MKYLGLLGIVSLLTTLVAAVPLEKRVYVYQTITKEVVVTVDVTTTVTVKGSSAGTPSSSAFSVPTVDAGESDESSSNEGPANYNYDQPAPSPSQQQPAVVEHVTAPEQTAPVVDPALASPSGQPPLAVPSPVVYPEQQQQPAPVGLAPGQTSSTTVAAPVPSASGQQTPSCDPEVSCQGKATVFDLMPNELPACGLGVDGTAVLAVALSRHLMGEMSNGGDGKGNPGPKELLNPYCGRKIQVTMGDKSVVAEVVDKCPFGAHPDDPNGCVYENVDLSRAAAAQLGYDTGRHPVEWHFIS